MPAEFQMSLGRASTGTQEGNKHPLLTHLQDTYLGVFTVDSDTFINVLITVWYQAQHPTHRRTYLKRPVYPGFSSSVPTYCSNFHQSSNITQC